MLFNIIRVVLLLILLICAVMVIKKIKYKHKKMVLILISVLCITLVTVSGMFPLENLFINFKSPESVFKYAEIGAIYEIIEGNDSSLVIYSDSSGSYSHYIVPKTTDGYKIPNYFYERNVLHKFDRDGAFDVYNAEGTQDYYVFCAVNFQDGVNDISVFNAEDVKIESSIVRIKDTNFVFFYLSDLSNGYYLMINGEKISLSNQSTS